MRYELKGTNPVVVDDKGVHITDIAYKEEIFIPFSKIVAVSVKKPGALTLGHIFFQTASDSGNPLKSRNKTQFKKKELYDIACEIKAEVEKVIS